MTDGNMYGLGRNETFLQGSGGGSSHFCCLTGFSKKYRVLHGFLLPAFLNKSVWTVLGKCDQSELICATILIKTLLWRLLIELAHKFVH